MTRIEFDGYVRQQSRRLYAVAFRLLRNQEEAEDAVQEVFIKLWKMGQKLDEYTSIEALSTKMTQNYCIDQIRKRKFIFQDQSVTQDVSFGTSASPHDLMENRESDELIHNLIESLPVIYREMIKLREIEGLSYEEIAEKTAQNINTLRVTLSRARGLLRDEYKKYFNEERRTGQFA